MLELDKLVVFIGEVIADIVGALGLGPAWVVVAQLLVAGLAIVAFAAVAALILVLAERKVSARIQMRLGPNRVGPFGGLQTIADAVKLLQKENITPANVDRGV